MTVVPYTTPTNANEDGTPNLFGVALLAGRLTGTVVGRDGHITVNATCKAKGDSGKWSQTSYADAHAVYLTVPQPDGEWADKIGTYYPPTSPSKWAGHFFTDRAQTDERRVKAARYLLDVAFGLKGGAHVLLADRCLRCSREITHPDSIGTGFGPECIKKVGEFMPNRSGTSEGAHATKAKGDRPVDVEPDSVATAREFEARVDQIDATPLNDELLRELTEAELLRAIGKATARGDDARVERYVREYRRRGDAAKYGEQDAYADRMQFTPPTPNVDVAGPIVTREQDAEGGLRYVLKLGDDPQSILDNAGA